MVNEHGLSDLRESIAKARLVYGDSIEVKLAGGSTETDWYEIVMCRPSTIPGYLRLPECITKVDATSFINCNDIYKLEIESKHRIEIGNFAFSDCCNLREVSIKAPIYKIGDGAFEECTRLKEIEIHCGCIEIGGYAFKNTAIKELKIPESCQSIGDFVCMDCNSLESIIMPAYINCEKSNGNMLGFIESTKLKNIRLPENLDCIHPFLVKKCVYTGKLTIPKSVKVIYRSAFEESYIKELEMHSNIWIYPKAFWRLDIDKLVIKCINDKDYREMEEWVNGLGLYDVNVKEVAYERING